LLFLVYYIVINNRKVVVLSFQANIYAIFIAKLFNVKIISRSNSSPSGWSKNFLKNFIFKTILKFADTTIVNSRDFQKQMYKKFLVKSLCIYNPFYKEIIKKKIKENSKNYFLKNQLKLVAIGRLTEQKDFITLLKAINIIKTKIFFKLIIIGKGYEKKKLKTFIKNNELNNCVKLLGYTTNPFIIMKQSDAVILTSKFEGLPNVLLEAQFLKKYIISSDCPTGPREILLNGKAGDLFKVGNYNDLAKKIINLKYNMKNNKKKILLGYKYFYRFDFKINCEKYYKIVKKYL
jgi:glycosyltransferase involved in cell wall biosynthesis